MIRAITKSDIPDLARAYVASFHEVDPSEEWTVAQAIKLIEFFLEAQPDMAFVAIKHKQVAGGIFGLVKPWWDGNHLVETELFVSSACKKQGIGSQLLLHFLKQGLKMHGARFIDSITFKNFDFPASWYDRLGFEDKQDWKVILGDVSKLVKKLESKEQPK